MAHVNANGTPTKGRIGGWSYFESIYGILVRIATNIVPKGRKQSKAQRVVQLALANWVILWRKFAKRLEPTFSLRPKSESACNAFVRANWERVRIYFTKEMVEAGACVATPCEINHGDLDPTVLYWKDSTENWMVTDFLLGDLVIDANTTVGEFSRAITTCNRGVFPEEGTAKANYIDFFCVQQVVNLDTRFPDVRIVGHSLKLNNKSTEKLWEALGGNEGFQSYKGHLATPYVAKDLYAWVRLVRDNDDGYRGTTQNLMGDNTATINQYTTEEAFLAACESYGGFSQKFLTPYKAKCTPFNYLLRTFVTVPGENPLVRDESEGGGGNNGDGPTTGGPGTVHEVTVTCTVQGGHGTVNPASHTVTFGSNISFTAVPDEGYRPDWPNGSHDLTYSLQARESTNITLTFSPKTSGGNPGEDFGSRAKH